MHFISKMPHTRTQKHKSQAPERYQNQPSYCRSLCSPLPKKLKIKDSQNPLLLEYLERKKQMIEKQGTRKLKRLNGIEINEPKNDVNVAFLK